MSAQVANGRVFTDKTLAATGYSEWIETENQDVNVHLWWLGTSTPVGAFTVELSNDPLILKEKERGVSGSSSAAAKVDITASIDPVHGTGFTVNNGTNPGSTMFALTGGMARFFRVVYTRSSGGAANALQGAYHTV